MSAPALTLYPYQQAWLASKAQFKIGMFARQTGKTFTSSLGIVNDVLDAEAASRTSKWVILSRGERQAREVMLEGIQRHLRAYAVAFKAAEYDWGTDGSGPKYKALEATLPGGSRIIALPANPDTARGFSANVYLDEFAFHQDSRAIWRSVFPIVSAGWKCWVTSTPNGKGNKFYDLMTGTGAGDIWERHVCDIYRAVAEGLPRDIAALKAAIGDEDAWAQEYELKWLDEASAWLPFDLISAAESPLAGRPELCTGGLTFIGVDIGIRGDLWVAWVLELVGDVLWTREVVTLRRATFAEQDATLDALMCRYRPLRLAMDQTGLGEKPVEDAQRRYGSRVEGVIFGTSSKQALAQELKDAMEDRRLRIPEGDAALRADLHKVQRVTSATGAPRFVAERDGQGHADRFWALALAVSAASDARAPIDFHAVPSPREPGEGLSLSVESNRGFGAVVRTDDCGGFL